MAGGYATGWRRRGRDSIVDQSDFHIDSSFFTWAIPWQIPLGRASASLEVAWRVTADEIECSRRKEGFVPYRG
jgi:hypothetical protein